MEYYSAIKNNTFESVLMRWMDLEPVILSEVSQKKKCKKAKWLSEETLQTAVKRREAKSKGEKERYTHLNAECCATCVLSHFSHVRLFATPGTVAHQATLSMGFSRQECWSGLPCPPPGDLPNPGVEPPSLMSPALAGRFLSTVLPGKSVKVVIHIHNGILLSHKKEHI